MNVDTMFLHKTLESPLSDRSCLALFGVCSLTEDAGRKYAAVCIVKELSVFSLLSDAAAS